MSRPRIPGIPQNSEVAIQGIVEKLEKRLDTIENGPTSPAIIASNFIAREGQYLRIQAPPGGLTIQLPTPLISNRGARITLSFETTNPVALQCNGGLVNRYPQVVNTALGTFDAICDGQSGWSVALGLSSSGSPTDAQYFVGATHASLSNERVAADTTEIDVVLTTPGAVSWVLRDGSVSLGRLVPIADDTFLGNISGSSASAAAISFNSFAGDGISYDAVNHQWDVNGSTSITVTADQVQRAALTGAISAAINSNATLFAGIRSNNSATNDRTNLNFINGVRTAVSVTDDAANDELEVKVDWTGIPLYAEGVGPVLDAYGLIDFRGGAGLTVAVTDFGSGVARVQFDVGGSTSIIAGTNDLQRAALTGAIAASQNSNATVFAGIRDNNAAENDRTNLNFVSGTFVNVAVADDAANDELEISASLAPVAAGSVYGNQVDAGGSAIAVLTGLEVGELLRIGTVQALSISTTINDQSLNADTTVLRVTPTGTQSLTGLTGGVQGRLLLVENIASSGNNLDLESLTGSLAANQFRTPRGIKLRLGFRESALLRWDSNNGDWRVIATSKTVMGIRDNNSDENARNNLNFVSSTSATLVVTDDAANDELEVTVQRAALTGDITASANSNTTAFRTFSAKSILANATNASAVPSDLAGTGAFQYVRVNSGNTGLEWSTLSGHASTSIIYNSNTFERAALTGAITASQNSNATLFAGIRVGGAATTDRTNINFISGAGITLTPSDDAANDEIEITISSSSGAAGHGIRDNGSLETQRANLNFVSSTSNTIVCTDDAANNETEVTVQRAALTGDVTASANSNTTAFRSFSANSILANATPGSAVPTELAIGTDNIPARITGNLISLPLSNLAGGALSYGSGVISVVPDSTHDIFIDSAGVGFRKDQASCWLFEDWQFNDANKSIATTPSTVHGSTSSWGCQASVASGSVSRGNNASGRPGTLNLVTSSTINSSIDLFSGTGASGPGSISSIRADDIYQVEIASIIPSTASIGMYLGVSDGTGFANCILFRYDTGSGDATIKTITSEAGVATVKDTGIAPGTSDRLYTWRQESAQTISFYIDDVLETVHISSENVPDTESVGIHLSLATRTGASKTLSIDYISLHSQELAR